MMPVDTKLAARPRTIAMTRFVVAPSARRTPVSRVCSLTAHGEFFGEVFGEGASFAELFPLRSFLKKFIGESQSGGFHDARDGGDEAIPVGGVGGVVFPSLWGKPEEPGAPVGFGKLPSGMRRAVL
jgi:hypothetical protein